MSYLTSRPLVCLCMLAASSSGLYAVDGVVLINQAAVMAGNVTPGDTPGFPVTISQPGSYRLTGNLVVPDVNTTAVIITADHVTLDLNGFSILGPAVCTSNPTVCPPSGAGSGVVAGSAQVAGPTAVRVVNGSIRGMGSSGIFLTGDGSFVERVNADSNAGAGIIVAGTVIASAASHNGTFGILAITVRECTAVDNIGDGIVLDGSGGVGISNIASFNGGRGIVSQNATVTGNTIVRNGSFGISAICPSTIVGNTIIGNTLGTINPDAQPGCVLVNNATR